MSGGRGLFLCVVHLHLFGVAVDVPARTSPTLCMGSEIGSKSCGIGTLLNVAARGQYLANRSEA